MEQQILKLSLTGGNILFATINTDKTFPSININIEYVCGKQEKICFVEFNSLGKTGEEICTSVYSSDDEEPVYYESYFKSISTKV